MSTRKNKLTWVIVMFSEAKDYSVVPTKWLVQNDTNNLSMCNVQHCYWPLGRVTSAEINDAPDPEQSWYTYRIKVLGGNKTYDNFSKAWLTRVEKESENEYVQLPSKRNRTTFDVSDRSSKDFGFSITPAQEFHQIQNKTQKTFTDLQSNDQTFHSQHEPIMQSPNQNIHLSSLSDQIVCLPNSTAYHTTIQSTSSSQSSMQLTSSYQPSVQSTSVYQPSIQDLQSTKISSQYTMQSESLSFESLDTKLTNIYQGQIATNHMLNRIFAKIELMEANSKNKFQNNDPTVYIDSQFLSYFPIKNADELFLLENRIKNEFEFVLKLETFIRNIGGNSAKQHVKRVMSKLFTDEYCVKISWTGRGWVKDMTKLKETNLIQIMKKIIQENSPTTFTDSQFEKEITERLRTANTRFKSSQSKDNSAKL